MANVNDVYKILDEKAPFSLQMDFDNAGFLIGRANTEVTKVLIALDITNDVIDEAIYHKAELIITHHPIIFDKLATVTDTSPNGELILKLIENNIAVISAHTNLDKVNGGVNTVLAESLSLQNTVPLEFDSLDNIGMPIGIGRVGDRNEGEISLCSFISDLKEALQVEAVRVLDAGKPVKRVAVGGGACGSMLPLVKKENCDTFVTADIKHDIYLQAKHWGINLIDAGHFKTEVVICNQLRSWIEAAFTSLDVVVSSHMNEVFAYQ